MECSDTHDKYNDIHDTQYTRGTFKVSNNDLYEEVEEKLSDKVHHTVIVSPHNDTKEERKEIKTGHLFYEVTTLQPKTDRCMNMNGHILNNQLTSLGKQTATHNEYENYKSYRNQSSFEL